jgi:hypothetical protein
MKTLEVRYKGLSMVAIVDDADFERVSERHWYVTKTNKHGVFYAVARIGPRKLNRMIYMHRFILNAQPGQMVDHRNQNGLDNRRENLRFCNGTQSMGNTRPPCTNTTGFKGVTHHSGKYWTARIQFQHRNRHIGMFPTAIDAARAYDAKALELFGEFARTNAMLGLL